MIQYVSGLWDIAGSKFNQQAMLLRKPMQPLLSK